MFNLGFTSSNASRCNADEQHPPQQKRGKRTRRRRNRVHRNSTIHAVPSKQHDAPMTKSDIYFALDCEMVGIGPEGFDSAVARVTLVNWDYDVVLDTFVQVPVPVTDYRTDISGVGPSDLGSGMTFEEARSAVERIVRGKILVGHGLENDLRALGLTHPWCDVRDTACYKPFMRESMDHHAGAVPWQPRKLRDLTWEKLGRQIQWQGRAHCPLEDAISALDLYKSVRDEWENELVKLQREVAREADHMKSSFNYWTPLQTMPPGADMNGMPPPVDQVLPVGPFVPIPEYPNYAGYEGVQPPPPPTSSPTSWFLSPFSFQRRTKTPPAAMPVFPPEEQEHTDREVENMEPDGEAATDSRVGNPGLFTLPRWRTPPKARPIEEERHEEEARKHASSCDEDKKSPAGNRISSPSFFLLPRWPRTPTKLKPTQGVQENEEYRLRSTTRDEDKVPPAEQRLGSPSFFILPRLSRAPIKVAPMENRKQEEESAKEGTSCDDYNEAFLPETQRKYLSELVEM